jgi:PAS domain S-box-containing protein
MQPTPDFRIVFDASPNAYVLLDRELRFVDANRAYLELTASRLEQLIGRAMFDLFPNDPGQPNNESARVLRESFERVLRTGKQDALAYITYRVAKVEGGELEDRVWSATHTPLLDAAGEVAFILQHTVDVTGLQPGQMLEYMQSPESVRAQAGVLDRAQQIAESNRALDSQIADLRNVFDQAPGFVCYLRGQQLIVEISNHAYNQLVGRDDLIGKPVREALPDQPHLDLLDQVFTTGRPFVGRGMRLELTRPPSGELEELLVDFVYQPIFDGEGRVLGILVQGNDVTEQKRQEQRQRFLARAGECLSAAATGLEAALLALARSSLSGFADLVSLDLLEPGGFRRALVAAADASLESLARANYAFAPDSAEPALHIRRARAEGRPVWLRELSPEVLSALARDDDHRALIDAVGLRSLVSVPIGAGPTFVGVLTFALARGRRRYEAGDVAVCEELTRMIGIAADNSRLSRERTELLQQAQAARERAEAANQAKDEFLAMLGHELRNPLAPILTAVQLMKLRGDTASERERVIIERQAQHMVRLVDDLLDVSRIARGKVALRESVVDLRAVVHKAVEITSPLLEQKQHHLTLDMPTEPLSVFGDEARLAQVFANLLSNAARYTPNQGEIRLRAALEDNAVVVRVRDNGSGISADMLPRVFELFAQAPQRSDRAEGGLGLGLTVVRNLVSLHGGEVSAHSGGPGQGSELVVRLPILQAGERAPDPGKPESAPPGPGRRTRVLIVDDNADAAELLEQLLKRRGYVTSVAFDGPSAIAAAGSFQPELAILDIGLPVMDGYELATQLRTLLAPNAPRLIALTGYGQEHDRQRSIEAGFAAHIVKPVDAQLLFEALAAEDTRTG